VVIAEMVILSGNAI